MAALDQQEPTKGEFMSNKEWDKISYNQSAAANDTERIKEAVVIIAKNLESIQKDEENTSESNKQLN